MFLEYFKELAKLDAKLSELDDRKLNEIYVNVFDNDAGKLVLRDLQNRCFVNSAGKNEFDEGVRSVYLTIQTRLFNAVNGEKKEGE